MSFSTLCRAFFYCLSTALSALFRHIYQRSLKKKSGLTSMMPLFIPRYFKINKVKKIVFPSSTRVDFIFSPANFVVFFIITKRKNMLYNIFFNTFALFLHISPLKHTIKHFNIALKSVSDAFETDFHILLIFRSVTTPAQNRNTRPAFSALRRQTRQSLSTQPNSASPAFAASS